MNRTALVLGAAALAAFSGPASAQKYPGVTLPAPAPAYRPAPRPAMPAPPQQPSPGGSNPAAEQLSESLPLDPATREMRDGRPADIAGTERRLGLREAHGPRTDLRGHTPSAREIVDVLAPR